MHGNITGLSLIFNLVVQLSPGTWQGHQGRASPGSEDVHAGSEVVA